MHMGASSGAPSFLCAHAGASSNSYHRLTCVLVVIAIIAITVFRPKLQELWDSIADGINAL